MKQENILFLILLLLWLTSIAGLACLVGWAGAGPGAGLGTSLGTCLFLVLVIVIMCRCLRDCARCCDGTSEEEEEYYETVWIEQRKAFKQPVMWSRCGTMCGCLCDCDDGSTKTEKGFQATDNVTCDRQQTKEWEIFQIQNVWIWDSAITPRIMRRFKFTKWRSVRFTIYKVKCYIFLTIM